MGLSQHTQMPPHLRDSTVSYFFFVSFRSLWRKRKGGGRDRERGEEKRTRRGRRDERDTLRIVFHNTLYAVIDQPFDILLVLLYHSSPSLHSSNLPFRSAFFCFCISFVSSYVTSRVRLQTETPTTQSTSTAPRQKPMGAHLFLRSVKCKG